MASPTIWTCQPGFALYTLYTLGKALVKLPCLLVLYTLPRFRPLPEWTHKQAFSCALTRLLFDYISTVEYSPAQSLDPAKEKDRFVSIAPFLD